jgi:hypothetical protein
MLFGMQLQIDKEILDQVSECPKNHQCLSGEACNCSEAETLFVGEQRFICHGTEQCTYKVSFGSNFFCGCPVRMIVFDQTGK